ncbi:MAG TPA: hypothetical protein VM658_19965 [bacterium]|nr:hypothetical protein [bacterium]
MGTPSNRSVKGSVVIDYVRMVRATPDQPWDRYLLPEDMALIKQMVLPGSWYPIGFFQRIGLAVFKLVAKENNELLRAFGKSIADRLHADHPGMVSKDKPRNTLEKYIWIQKRFYNFDAFNTEDQGPGRLLVHIYSLPEEVGIPVYIIQISGMVERLIELSGHTFLGIKVTTANEPDRIISTMDVSWQV